MENNQISKIAMRSSGNKKSHFNWSHDVNTSCSFGHCQPIISRFLVPKSKTTVKTAQLVRLAPMARPAFARLKYKTLSGFVGFSELTENFPHLLAKTPVARGQTLYNIAELPHISLGLLSYLVLVGAKCSVWYQPAGLPANRAGTYVMRKIYNDSSDTAARNTFNTLFANSQIFRFDRYSVEFPSFVGTVLDLWEVFGNYFGTTEDESGLEIPLSNYSNYRSFFDAKEYVMEADNPNPLANFDYVTLEGADYVLDIEKNGYKIALAFRLSDYGKRIHDILVGLGYQIDFQSKTKVSMMPIFACWKFYFDNYGLVLNDNWYTTSLYKLLTFCDYHNKVNFDTLFAKSEFITFINDLANMWVTNQQDYTSAHLNTTAKSTSFGLSTSFIDVDGSANITEVDNANGVQTSGHSFINNVKHGQLDAEYLKRLYMCVNRNTVIGRDVAALLRAQGLGDFVDNCKTHFIGATETDIEISDVVSTSDTFNAENNNGALLGQYAGLGIGRNYGKDKNPKTLSYSNDEFGYWVTLASMIPDSGFCQQLDGTLLAIDKNGLYQPEFDGLGYEATRKQQIVGAQDWCKPTEATEANRLDATFGFVPRYSAFKVQANKINGSFALRSVRNDFLPYTLDKVVQVGEKELTHLKNASTQFPYPADPAISATVQCQDLLTPLRLPKASTIWRYVARYAFLGNYNRIFANVGYDFTNEHDFFDALVGDEELRARFAYLVRTEDNFLIHNVVNMQCYAPMKAIEMSFETFDDGEQPNMAVAKA